MVRWLERNTRLMYDFCTEPENRQFYSSGRPHSDSQLFLQGPFLKFRRVNFFIFIFYFFRGRKNEGSTADIARKRPQRPWTAARTTEVFRRCPLAIAQRLMHCTTAVSTAVLGRVTRTMSVALLLSNNSKRKKSTSFLHIS